MLDEQTPQADLIDAHRKILRLWREGESERLSAHFEHMLFSLHRLIEAYGPTQQFQRWLSEVESTQCYPAIFRLRQSVPGPATLDS